MTEGPTPLGSPYAAVMSHARLSRPFIIVAVAALTMATIAIAGPAAAADDPDAVGLVDPATGIWRLRTVAGNVATFYFGDPGDVPFAGDWDCDGVDTPGLYRQSDGYVYLRNSNDQGPADIAFFFGNPGDVPLPGDFDGDGCDTVSVYRPSQSRVYVINELGDGDQGLGAADYDYYFGNPGDTPFTGDFNADGSDSVGLYRESTGFTYLRLTNTQGTADLSYFFGNPSDLFVAGDWDADGDDTPGVFRPSNTTFYLKNSNVEGTADVSFPFGQSAWLPIAGRWGDVEAVPPLELDLITPSLSQPVFLDAPKGDDRLFVVEKGGTIRIIENGTLLTAPFLTIGGLSSGGEQGLLGLAFHPDYASNGRFFVDYTNSSGDTRVVEYHADPSSNVADPTPTKTLLAVDQPATNHNGGMIQFGPDGFLWVSLGDGGGSPGTRPQDKNDPLGSILRLDVDKPSGANGAAGNPYMGKDGDDRIWAIGLRNPWRIAIDAEGGVIVVADVGQGRREEVNVVSLTDAPVNYGWPYMEGTLCYPADPCSSAGLALPQVEYTHAEGISITGGYVYRGAAIPEIAGRYFYGDYGSGFIRSFAIVGTAAVSPLDHVAEFGSLSGLSSFGTDGAGELYVMTLGGNLYRIDRAA